MFDFSFSCQYSKKECLSFSMATTTTRKGASARPRTPCHRTTSIQVPLAVLVIAPFPGRRQLNDASLVSRATTHARQLLCTVCYDGSYSFFLEEKIGDFAPRVRSFDRFFFDLLLNKSSANRIKNIERQVDTVCY